MSRIIIKIDKNLLKIKIKDKLNELTEEEIIEMFSIILAFKIEEKSRGNEYDKAWLKIEYVRNLLITENINVFNLVRIPNLYEFANYFKRIENMYDSQNVDTKISLNDYFTQTENISQEIIITMVFEIESKVEDVEKTRNTLLKSLKMSGSDKEVFEIIKKGR